MSLILSLETSCDETAVALLSKEVILSECVYSQTAHAEHGGVVPEIAARDHQARLPSMVHAVMDQSGCLFSDIAEIAYTQGPGLAGCLLVGHYYAHGLAHGLGVPLRGIHHLEGHIMSALTLSQGPWIDRYYAMLPCIVLIVSGGHTLFVEVREDSYTVLGETMDDAVGEVFDKIARLLGYPYPGARALSECAQHGKPMYTLPMPMLHKNGGMMSFSGLKTAARVVWERLASQDDPTVRTDFACSFEQALMHTLMQKIQWVMEASKLQKLVVVGGVSANRYLRSLLDSFSTRSGIECMYPPLAYCTDNAAMIGIAAWVRRSLGCGYDNKNIQLKFPLQAPLQRL